MLKAYKYVFAIQQNVGTNVIDTETDKLVKTIENKDIQGIAQTPDGKVWLASTNKIERLDPLTLLTDTTVALPEGMTISCSWGLEAYTILRKPHKECAVLERRGRHNRQWRGLFPLRPEHRYQ